MASPSRCSVFISYTVLFMIITCFHLTCLSKPVVFQLTHSLSNSKFNSTHHLLKSTTTHSSHRFLNHRRQVSVALSPGSDYTMSFSLGSSSKTPVTLYMDTGSDLVWVPCKPFTCIMCEGKSNPKSTPSPHDIYSSSAARVTCQSRACSSVHNHVPSSHLCAMSRCPLDSIEMSECQNYTCPSFYYAYGDGSFVGRLYEDVLELPMSAPPSLTVENFTFGCAHEALGEPIGVAGFGRGALSLPAQLAAYSPNLGSQFSYFLISHSFDSNRVSQPSPLVLGRRVDLPLTVNKVKHISQPQPFVYTPMLENTKHPYYYYVGLEGVTVGKKRITAPLNLTTIDGKGNGGMVVDSGTTYSMLPEELYNSVVGEFGKTGYKRAREVEDKTGLSPCYYTDQPVRGTEVSVPQLVLNFGGNSSVVMPKKNYFYEFTDGKKVKRKVGCMTLMNAGYFPDSGGPAGLLGNYQQQGLEVVYDLLNKRVGFARRKCSSLWDTLG